MPHSDALVLIQARWPTSWGLVDSVVWATPSHPLGMRTRTKTTSWTWSGGDAGGVPLCTLDRAQAPARVVWKGAVGVPRGPPMFGAGAVLTGRRVRVIA